MSLWPDPPEWCNRTENKLETVWWNHVLGTAACRVSVLSREIKTNCGVTSYLEILLEAVFPSVIAWFQLFEIERDEASRSVVKIS